MGIDETLERRYGKKISARGVYRDPVRSTHEQFVKSSGIRWVCVMLLVEVPWASWVRILPFFSALARDKWPCGIYTLHHRASIILHKRSGAATKANLPRGGDAKPRTSTRVEVAGLSNREGEDAYSS